MGKQGVSQEPALGSTAALSNSTLGFLPGSPRASPQLARPSDGQAGTTEVRREEKPPRGPQADALWP